jgi:hypothetical protein
MDQPEWTKSQETSFCAKLDDDSGQGPVNKDYVDTDYEHANLVTSAIIGTGRTKHKPLLDIDLPCVLLPSSTEGHFHLFIDKEIPHEKYLVLIHSLEDCGIIEAGIRRQMTDLGRTAVRKPGIKKEVIDIHCI